MTLPTNINVNMSVYSLGHVDTAVLNHCKAYTCMCCVQGKRRILSPPVVINADKNVYALGQDVLAVLDRACQESIPMLRSASNPPLHIQV